MSEEEGQTAIQVAVRIGNYVKNSNLQECSPQGRSTIWKQNRRLSHAVEKHWLCHTGHLNSKKKMPASLPSIVHHGLPT